MEILSAIWTYVVPFIVVLPVLVPLHGPQPVVPSGPSMVAVLSTNEDLGFDT